MAVFYLVAGVNHFYNPEAYYRIIPPFFSSPHVINIASGIAEIFFGVLLLIPPTRKPACYGIICMLIVFIPAHIYMIKAGWCIQAFCLPGWMIWVRLIIGQPLLIFWALRSRE